MAEIKANLKSKTSNWCQRCFVTTFAVVTSSIVLALASSKGLLKHLDTFSVLAGSGVVMAVLTYAGLVIYGDLIRPYIRARGVNENSFAHAVLLSAFTFVILFFISTLAALIYSVII